jgi:hypothetical protein
MNLVPGSPAMVLNPDAISLSGDVTDQFKAAKAAF